MTSRRSHQCHRDGCDSQACWRMWVKFTSRTPDGVFVPINAESTIIVCDRHRKDAAEGFFSERAMDRFADGLEQNGLACPHPAAIQIEFAHYVHPMDVN
jgi:hypothetical protein